LQSQGYSHEAWFIATTLHSWLKVGRNCYEFLCWVTHYGEGFWFDLCYRGSSEQIYMTELCIYLFCMVGSCDNFHNLSIDPVEVKFGEWYSHHSKNLRKIWNLLFDTFNRVSHLCQKTAFLSVIFSIEKCTCSNAMKILW
jgi:hypothetical protein